MPTPGEPTLNSEVASTAVLPEAARAEVNRGKVATDPNVLLSDKLAKHLVDNPDLQKMKREAEALALPRLTDSDEEISELAEGNIGIGRDKDGKRTWTATETDAWEKVVDNARIARTVIEEGFDGLTDADEKDTAVALALEAVNDWPGFEGLDDAKKKKIVEIILNDPSVRAEIKKIYQERLTEKAALEDDVSLKKEEFDIASEEIKRISKETRINATAISTAGAELDDYKATGRRGTLLKDVQSRRGTIQSTLAGSDRRLASLDASLARADNRYRLAIGKDATELAEAKAERDRTQRERDNYEALVAQAQADQALLASLEAEYKELKDEHQRLTTERDELREKEKEARTNLIKTRSEYESAAKKRKKSERDFSAGVENVIHDGTINYLKKATEAAESEYQKVLDEEKLAAVTEDDKLLESFKRARWSEAKDPGRLDKNNVRYKKEQIREDYQSAILNGPDGLVGKMLAGYRKPDGSRYSDEEIKAKMEDSQFMEKARTQLMADLLTHKVMHAGGIPPKDLDSLMMTDWGPKAIDAALAKREDIKKTLARLKEEKIIEGTSVKEIMEKQKGKKNIIGLLLMLLSFGAGAIAFEAVKAIATGTV